MNTTFSIWKPENYSSYDVIRIIKSNYNNIKIGHAGTLDPFAEGVLVVSTGKRLKHIDKHVSEKKTYFVKAILNYETDTLDKTGTVIKENKNPIDIDENKLNLCLNSFDGNYMQRPPYYSAKKINGVPLYKFARKGIYLNLKGQMVKIYKISLISYNMKSLSFNVVCGPGTYIRALVRDVAYSLGTFAYVEKLIRSNVGSYNNTNSISLNNLKYAYNS